MITPTVPPRSGSANILLVDENRSGRAARKSVLEELGHSVTTAACGEDALDRFSKAKFDLVVTGQRMARMNGVELIGKIRGLDQAVPIIMLSGFVDALGLTEANTGADLVLAKSANEVTHLIRAVSRLLRLKAAKKPPASQRSTLKARRRSV
jgi:CheY-like chemotaxis protein